MAKSDGRLELLLTSAIFIVIEATNALGFTLFTSFPAVPVWPVYYTIRMLVFAPVAGMSLLIITLRVSALCFKSLALQERLWTVSAVTVAIITPCSIVGNLLSAPHVDWSRNAAEDFGTDWSSQLLLLINAVFPVAAGAMTVCSVHAALVPLFLAPGREETQSWWKRVCDAARGSRLLRLKSQQLPPSGPTVAMITTLHDHTVDNVGKGNSSIGVSMSSNTTQALSLSANTTRASASISASTNCAFASTSGVLTAAPAMPAPAVPTPAIAQPARLRSAHQIQSHLGFTFWLLTAAYVAGWAVLFLFHSLATVNLFLGMSISTLVTACCLIIESLFKLIVKARVTHRADVSNVTTRLKRSTDKSAGLEATDSTNHGDSITSMGQLAVSSWPTLAKLTAARRTSAGQETVHSVELSLARRRSSTTLAPRTDTARALSDGGQPGKKAKSVTAATTNAAADTRAAQFVRRRSRCLGDSDGRLELLILAAICIVGETTNALITVLRAPFPVVPIWPEYYTARSILFFPVGGLSLLIITLRVASLCFKSQAVRDRMWYAAIAAVLLLTPPFIAGNLLLAPATDWNKNTSSQSRWWSVLLYVNTIFPIAALVMTAYSVRVALACHRTPPVTCNGEEGPRSKWNRWRRASEPVRAAPTSTSTVHTGSTAATSAVSSTADGASAAPPTTAPAAARGSSSLQVPDVAQPPAQGVSRSRSLVSSLRVSATRRTTPVNTSSDKSIQTALGTTFWLLTAGYLVIWAAQLAYNTLSAQNSFLRMAVTTSFTTCWLVVETLFKMIVRARVRNRRRVGPVAAAARQKVPSGSCGEARRASIDTMGQLDLGSVDNLETPQAGETGRPGGSSGQQLNEH
ncbi:hypothetical protein GGF31_007367 [Allomyces arbusculus]|nr:hypothetical protein GGF31_007367 [Allomyces arbusculus]